MLLAMPISALEQTESQPNVDQMDPVPRRVVDDISSTNGSPDSHPTNGQAINGHASNGHADTVSNGYTNRVNGYRDHTDLTNGKNAESYDIVIVGGGQASLVTAGMCGFALLR